MKSSRFNVLDNLMAQFLKRSKSIGALALQNGQEQDLFLLDFGAI
jgi:hypothetical protein